jgi:hypothetical protein
VAYQSSPPAPLNERPKVAKDAVNSCAVCAAPVSKRAVLPQKIAIECNGLQRFAKEMRSP